ncbi:hypothetical protein EMIT0P294_150113 [Pseudomonas sp. IT-P294]
MGAGLPAMAVCQSTLQHLTHPHREQARSHRERAMAQNHLKNLDPEQFPHQENTVKRPRLLLAVMRI